MAGAVVEIKTGLPQGNTRERIDLRARGALGKNRPGNADMAPQDTSVAVAHQGGWLADREGAGDVGRAVLVLTAQSSKNIPGRILVLVLLVTR